VTPAPKGQEATKVRPVGPSEDDKVNEVHLVFQANPARVFLVRKVSQVLKVRLAQWVLSALRVLEACQVFVTGRNVAAALQLSF